MFLQEESRDKRPRFCQQRMTRANQKAFFWRLMICLLYSIKAFVRSIKRCACLFCSMRQSANSFFGCQRGRYLCFSLKCEGQESEKLDACSGPSDTCCCKRNRATNDPGFASREWREQTRRRSSVSNFGKGLEYPAAGLLQGDQSWRWCWVQGSRSPLHRGLSWNVWCCWDGCHCLSHVVQCVASASSGLSLRDKSTRDPRRRRLRLKTAQCRRSRTHFPPQGEGNVWWRAPGDPGREDSSQPWTWPPCQYYTTCTERAKKQSHRCLHGSANRIPEEKDLDWTHAVGRGSNFEAKSESVSNEWAVESMKNMLNPKKKQSNPDTAWYTNEVRPLGGDQGKHQEDQGLEKGSMRKAMEVAEKEDRISQAVDKLKEGYWSTSTAKARSTKRREIMELTRKVVPMDQECLPLARSTIERVAAAIKVGGMKSGDQYVNELKLWHIEEGHPVPPWMGRLITRARSRWTGIRDQWREPRSSKSRTLVKRCGWPDLSLTSCAIHQRCLMHGLVSGCWDAWSFATAGGNMWRFPCRTSRRWSCSCRNRKWINRRGAWRELSSAVVRRHAVVSVPTELQTAWWWEGALKRTAKDPCGLQAGV